MEQIFDIEIRFSRFKTATNPRVNQKASQLIRVEHEKCKKLIQMN